MKPGQESVWDYPRPAVAETCDGHLMIVHRGIVLAETRRAIRTLETSHPPSYYFPRDDIAMQWLRSSSRSSMCEWKGQAKYFQVDIGGGALNDVGWSYASPTEAFTLLKDHIAFYAAPFDACFVDGEKVTPQPGSFYGGWITSRVAGPFKGAPGTMFW
ncbi:MAG: DUF427 domain-containing protein [Bosea sp. (in: a-proteobacteria)]